MDTIPLEVSAICVLLVILIVTCFIIKTATSSKGKRYPPGPWGVPIIGHLPFFDTDSLKTFAKWQKQYGNVFKIRLGSWDTVVINGYEAIKEAADKPHDDFSCRPNLVSKQILTEVNGSETLALAPFSPTYVQHRKLTVAALRMFALRPGNPTEGMIIHESMALVTSLLSKDYTQPRDIKSEIQYSTGSIIYQLLYGLGKQINIQKELQVIIDHVDGFVEFATRASPFDVMPWLKYIMPWKIKQLREILEGSLVLRQEQVKEHAETLSEDNIRDITDALLAADIGENEDRDHVSQLTRLRMVTTLNDLQSAGFDTDNKTLQWLMLYMATYPDIQKLVQKEIDDIVGNGRSVQLTDREGLVYTDATIHEVMRVTTIVPMALPKYTTQDTRLTGYNIDKGTVVFFNLHSISHEKEFWVDPDTFRPSRLITENNELDITKCNRILPFGLGRRRCVGENIARFHVFLTFVTIMQRCSIIKPDGAEFDLDPVPGLVYSPKDFKVIVKER